MFIQVQPVDFNGKPETPIQIRAEAIDYVSSNPIYGSKGRVAYFAKGELQEIGTVEPLADIVALLDDKKLLRPFVSVPVVDSGRSPNNQFAALPFEYRFNTRRIVAVQRVGDGLTRLSTPSAAYVVLLNVGDIMALIGDRAS